MNKKHNMIMFKNISLFKLFRKTNFKNNTAFIYNLL